MRDVNNAVEKAVPNNVIDDELAKLLIVHDSEPGNIYFFYQKFTKMLPHYQVDRSVIQPIHLQ